ncbi:MAG: hypothetical protein KF816_11290 [Melioribacteraceae bacterium]|jgi:hypothetical protein|nr:hypothetical protein [Melioribacteraceae bacterium]
MTDKKGIQFVTPILLAIIIFFSNFLSTDIFKPGTQSFAVWFVLSVFTFACGWLINKTLGYTTGGKVVFVVNVVASFITIIMISLFSEYFGLADLLAENLVTFVLRNITLGSIALFGMAVSEVIILQHSSVDLTNKQEELKNLLDLAERESQLKIDEAKIKAEKIVYEAQQKVDDLIGRKEQIERRLKEFISVEKELIDRYEKEEE